MRRRDSRRHALYNYTFSSLSVGPTSHRVVRKVAPDLLVCEVTGCVCVSERVGGTTSL